MRRCQKARRAECDATRANDIATYLVGLPTDCGEARALPQRLRLLTRREYRETVHDSFQASMAATCATDADCDVASESCTGGACTADPCNLHTFVYDAGGGLPEVGPCRGDVQQLARYDRGGRLAHGEDPGQIAVVRQTRARRGEL